MEWFDSVSSLTNLHPLHLDIHLIISLWKDISKYIVGKKLSNIVYFCCFHGSSKKARKDAYHLPW